VPPLDDVVPPLELVVPPLELVVPPLELVVPPLELVVPLLLEPASLPLPLEDADPELPPCGSFPCPSTVGPGAALHAAARNMKDTSPSALCMMPPRRR
jgi:hypothetical protein